MPNNYTEIIWRFLSLTYHHWTEATALSHYREWILACIVLHNIFWVHLHSMGGLPPPVFFTIWDEFSVRLCKFALHPMSPSIDVSKNDWPPTVGYISDVIVEIVLWWPSTAFIRQIQRSFFAGNLATIWDKTLLTISEFVRCNVILVVEGFRFTTTIYPQSSSYGEQTAKVQGWRKSNFRSFCYIRDILYFPSVDKEWIHLK